jgi:hypothetical protein
LGHPEPSAERLDVAGLRIEDAVSAVGYGTSIDYESDTELVSI